MTQLHNVTRVPPRCPKCGGDLDDGWLTAPSTLTALTGEVRPLFVIPGHPTSPNPIQAFKQGLADVPMDQEYRIDGTRCRQCGYVELYARERHR